MCERIEGEEENSLFFCVRQKQGKWLPEGIDEGDWGGFSLFFYV